MAKQNHGKHKTPGQFREMQKAKVNHARAPYNFVPLNAKVSASDFDKSKYPFDSYHEGLNTGYIDITMETKTPIYIRDTMTPEEQKEQERQKNEKKSIRCANSDFFSPAGRYRVPGSSIRGMIRTMVEIISFGKFGFFEDRLLYYRGLADKSRDFRNEYSKHMSSKVVNKEKTIPKALPGLMFKRGQKYFIIPGEDFKKMPEDNGEKRQYFKKIDEKNYLVISGKMKRKHEWKVVCEPDRSKAKEVPYEDILEYRNDRLRDEKAINVVKETAENEFVPCFYVLWKDTGGKDRVSFGHTPMFRLAYQKSIGDHVPAVLKNKEIKDISSALFGNEKDFAGRVYFEDAYLAENPSLFLDEEKVSFILSNPKPTSFQLYLEQKDPAFLNHYNTGANIRGYKLYWHKTGKNYIETDEKKIKEHPSQYTKIKPLKQGARFSGRIRFENLTDTELGALLFVLRLKENLFHKIGMGKPLGLGTLRISPRLFLSERKKRYSEFLFEFSGCAENAEKIEYYALLFDKYVRETLGMSENSLWDVPRIRELRCMLDFSKKPSDEKTCYMRIEPDNEFKSRDILPRPCDVQKT